MPRAKTQDSQDKRFMNVIKTLERDIQLLKGSFANKLRVVASASEPTLSVNGEVLLWHRTGDNAIFIVARANDSTKKVQIT